MSRHDDPATCRRRFLDEPGKLFLKLTSMQFWTASAPNTG